MVKGSHQDAGPVESFAPLRKRLSKQGGTRGVFVQNARHYAFWRTKSEHPLPGNYGAAGAMFTGETIYVGIGPQQSGPGYITADDQSVCEEVGPTSIHSRKRFVMYAEGVGVVAGLQAASVVTTAGGQRTRSVRFVV